MSVSELEDNGSPHSWANLRMNNCTVDGTLTATNLVIDNETINTLTVNNLTATNETVTNSTVTNETVTNSTVTNETVTNLTTINPVTVGTYIQSETPSGNTIYRISNLALPLYYVYPIRASIPALMNNQVLWSFSLANNYSLSVEFTLSGFNPSILNGSGVYYTLNNYYQVSNVVTNLGSLYSDKLENLTSTYAGKLTLTFSNSGTTLTLLASNSASFFIDVGGVVNIYIAI